MSLSKDEVWIAAMQSDYKRPDMCRVSEESRRSRTVDNFWSEGEKELEFRSAQKIPKERYREICEEFNKLVEKFLSIPRLSLNYQKFYDVAEEIGVYKK